MTWNYPSFFYLSISTFNFSLFPPFCRISMQEIFDIINFFSLSFVRMMKVRITLFRPPPEYFQIFIYIIVNRIYFSRWKTFFSLTKMQSWIWRKSNWIFLWVIFLTIFATSSSSLLYQLKKSSVSRVSLSMLSWVSSWKKIENQSNDCRIDVWKPNQSKLSFISDRSSKPSSISEMNQKTKIMLLISVT